MRNLTQEPFMQNSFFALQDNKWLENHRVAGKIAAQTLHHLEKLIINRANHSLLELNNIAEDMIVKAGGIPTFKNYKGFPAAVCTSVNEQLVHGIPTEYKLQEGDVISLDLGVTYNNTIADTALTCIYGNPKKEWHIKLIKVTEDAMYKGINAISIDKKLGVIGNAIYKSVQQDPEFSIITRYGGHGISRDSDGNGILHAPPFVANKASPDEGVRIQEGFVLAIEPMVTRGSADTHTVVDGWTVMTKNINAHMEHTVYVHSDRVEIITDRSNL